MVDSIIFDLDGTLWDSTEVIARAWNKTGLFPYRVTQEVVKSLMGKTNQQIQEDLCLEEALLKKAQQEEIRELFHNPTGIKLYDPTWSVLDALSQDYQVFINSNCQTGYIESFLNLEKGKATQYITDYKHSKPDKDKSQNLIDLIKQHNLNPVVVGDTESDYLSALHNGVRFVWAEYGFGVEKPEYHKAISQLSDLLKLIKQL